MADDVPPFYVVCAFRSTVIPKSKSDKKPEFIEVTFMAINTTGPKIEEKDFHAFVLPTVNPKLTDECKEFCQIKQYNIDHAETWIVVMKNLEKWMNGRGLRDGNFKLVIDGTYDFERDLRSQAEIAKWQIPLWANQWIDLRKAFRSSYNEGNIEIDKLNMKKMLDIAKIKFDGSDMSGHDEAFYLSMIIVNLLRKNPLSLSSTKSKSDSDWNKERPPSVKKSEKERPRSVKVEIERPRSAKKSEPDYEQPLSATKLAETGWKQDGPHVDDEEDDSVSKWD